MALACVLGIVPGYLLMRAGAHVQACAPDVMLALDTFGASLAAAPLAFPKMSGLALLAGAAGFLAPVLGVAYMVAEAGNYDLGQEYGDARWASPAERASVGDRKRLCNNLMLTSSCWLVLKAYTARQRRVLRGRNHNVYVIGTSGTGKSYQYVKPQVMQAVGSLLDPENIAEDAMPAAASKGPGAFAAKAGITGAVAALVRAQRAKKGIPGEVDEGCDLFVTDPKGDGIEDMGHLLEAAGYDIKCLNIVDIPRSLHYNPLAYIKTRLVDAKAPGQIVVTMRAEIDGKQMEPVRLRLGENVKSIPERLGQLSVAMTANTRVATPRDQLGVDALLREDIGNLMRRRGEKFTDAVKKIEYRTSSIDFEIEYRNLDWRAHEVTVTLALDDMLEAVSCDGSSAVGFDDPENPKTIVWSLGACEGRRKNEDAADVEPYVLEAHARIAHHRIPDGLDLVKTVECMVVNLKEPDKASSGDNQFWEDTERLMLMSLISYLFERFDPRHRNLGEVMRLLTMAKVSNDPSFLSDLDVLMESWETGLIYDMAPQAEEASAKRRRKANGRWEKTAEGAHDPANSLALHCYHAFKSGAPETLQSIVIACHAALVKLFPKEVQELVAYDEMHLDTLGDAQQRQAIFAIVDDTDSTFNFLFALMAYQAVNLNCEKAYKRYGGRLPRRVHFILDEFANIGKLPNFERTIAVVRSRGISISVILQSLTQLSSVYDKSADTIRDNFTTMVFLGGQSEKTLEGLSKLAGTETVDEITGSKQRGPTSSSSENRGRHGRDLVTVSQLRELDIGQAIVMMSGLKPVKDKKIETERHPLYRFIDPCSERGKGRPECLYAERFDIAEYRARREKGEQRTVTRHVA